MTADCADDKANSQTGAWQAHCWRNRHVSAADECKVTVLDALTKQAALHPDAPAFTELDSSGRQHTISFRQLNALSLAGAGWLHESAQVRRQDVLGIVPLNDLRSIVAIFAALRLGARVAFLDPLAPPGRHLSITDSLGVTSVIRSQPDVHGIDAHLFPQLSELSSHRAVPHLADPAAEAFYFPTSGSTAASKIVAQTHRAITSNALAIKRHHGLRHGDRFLGCLPIHHVNGLHFTIMATMFCGSHAVLPRGFDPFLYPRQLSAVAPRIASVVPSILLALLTTWREAKVPNDFSYFVSAAAPLPQNFAKSVWDRWGLRVLQGYGLTETTNFSTTMPTWLSDASYVRQMLEPDIPSVGLPMAGNEVAILRPDGTAVDPGEEGEICIRGHNVMARYVGNCEETEHAFRHGWFHSGDLGGFRDDPEAGPGFVVITGRAKNIAKIRGESVSLEEMERVLLTIPGVRDAACVALPDRLLGENIVVALNAGESISDLMVLARLRQDFSEASLPRRILRIEKVPRTLTGKLLRPQLRMWIDSVLRAD